MIIHEESRSLLKCYECDETFSRQDNLTRHNKEIHQVGNVNYHYSKNVSSNLPIHSVRPYTCQGCGNKFKRKEHADLHQVSCNQKEAIQLYSCDKCDMEFQKQSNLKRHVNTAHQDVGSLECTACGKVFKRKDNLLRHMKICKL